MTLFVRMGPRSAPPPLPPPPRPPVDPDSISNANCYDHGTGDVVEVASPEKLAVAVNTAPPDGRQVLLAPGTHPGGALTLNRAGAGPVVVRPRDGRGTAKIVDARWSLAVGSRRIVLADLAFDGARITVNGVNHRVSRSAFGKINGNTIFIQAATDTRVDHCDFTGYTASTGSKGCVILREEDVGSGKCRRVLIDHNYIHDIDPATGANGQEPLGLHASSNGADAAMPGLVIHRNLLARIRLPQEGEIVGAKTSGIVFSENTLVDLKSPSYLNAPRRACKIELRSNWFQNAPANILMVRSDDALVIGNRLVGGLNCYICSGNGYWSPTAAAALYFACRRARVIGNTTDTGYILVGEEPWGHKSAPVRDANLWGNTRTGGGAAHKLISGTQSGTTFKRDDEPYEPAVKLTPADVGLAAPDPFCPRGPQR